MRSRWEALEAVSPYCDIAERLRRVPPSAAMRGLYARSIESVLARAGQLQPYLQLFPERCSAVGWQPMSEFLVRLTVASALLMGPERVHEGMFTIGRNNAAAFTNSLLGKVLLRFLSRDPRKLLAQGVAGRRQSCTTGRWGLEFPTERTALVTMSEEYLYIESFLFGAAYGTFDLIGVPIEADVSLSNAFAGTHTLRWSGTAAPN